VLLFVGGLMDLWWITPMAACILAEKLAFLQGRAGSVRRNRCAYLEVGRQAVDLAMALRPVLCILNELG
jgi:predicted metal-binding membrane protein